MSDNPIKLLRLDASLDRENSVSRALADKLQAKLESEANLDLTYRDIADGIPRIDSAWREAMLREDDQRTDEDNRILAYSNQLAQELIDTDILLISSPVYNFSVTSDLKNWIDNVCRARMTFKYTEHGPRGLLQNKKAFIVLASNGTKVHSEIDFAGRYLKQIMTFLNITDVSFVVSDQMKKFDRNEKIRAAEESIEKLSL